jgi:thioredoxin reductase/NAD-dependent dihydropyrimidine dehydrogenase PreA subunit
MSQLPAAAGEAPLLPWVVLFLFGLFVVLGLWQRKVGRARTQAAMEKIREAAEIGSSRPQSLHPQINPRTCIGCASCVAACPEEEVLGLVDGIAHILHGSRCIGHGRCEAACPVGAITVGMGDVASRPDIPALSEAFETSVPGVYLAGEVGGVALIRHAIEQGARAVSDIAKRIQQAPRRVDPGVADVLIVGAGPAGLSASLKAIERGLSYLTIDQDDIGGTIRKYPRRKLAMTQPVDIPLYGRLRRSEYLKEELIDLWESLIRDFHLVIHERVKLLDLRRERGDFVARTSAGRVRCRFAVLALGRRGTPRKLDVPGEDSEKVLYQLIDAAGYTNGKFLVVGGGDSAIEAATALANQPGNDVTLSYRKPAFTRLKKRNEERIGDYVARGRIRAIFSSNVERIDPQEVLLATPAGIEGIPYDNVFVFAGGEPPFPLLRGIGVKFGGDGETDARPPGVHGGVPA